MERLHDEMTREERAAMDAAINRGERLAAVWVERDQLKAQLVKHRHCQHSEHEDADTIAQQLSHKFEIPPFHISADE